MRLGWGRDDGPFFFSCPGRKPHERCEPGPILLCMGLFSRFCVWAPRCTAEARRMGGANGSRECAPDDKLRDTHQFEFAKMMGFAKGSTHPTSLRAALSCPAVLLRLAAQAKSRDPSRDKTTRRANHPKPVQPVSEKYFAFAVGQIIAIAPPVSPDERGGSRSSRTCGGMRWTRKLRLTSVTRADGEAVWS
jgi:hypothetical protein